MRTTVNVIAETDAGRDDNVVVVGAHLDSVAEGPGINDNGSGSSTILEVAIQMAKVKPRNTVRFIWFGAEELGLLGSEYYVSQLSAAEVRDIAVMLNFDMVGSPNFVRFVYDGDNSAFPVGPGSAAGPPGSGYVERLFTAYFASVGLASEPTEFSGRSDYGPFIEAGIPAGGLFTGAEGVKTAQQAARRHRRCALRPVLPRGMRHPGQRQHHRHRADGGRRRLRQPHPRHEHRGREQ